MRGVLYSVQSTLEYGFNYKYSREIKRPHKTAFEVHPMPKRDCARRGTFLNIENDLTVHVRVRAVRARGRPGAIVSRYANMCQFSKNKSTHSRTHM